MKRDKKIIILGAGIAGMSCSYHLGHQNCIVIDKNPYKGGHCYTHSKDESLWDEGPHVSFTKNKYVQNLLWSNNNCKFSEFNAEIGNWYKGNWIPHPAQYNLHSIPKSLAKECLDDFLLMRKSKNNNKQKILKNYEEWLINAFGEKFARNFPFTYTKKYWTCNPKDLTTNWIGERLVYPNPKDIIEGFQNKSRKSSHYIKTFRYPKQGGFISFFNCLSNDLNIINKKITLIDLAEKKIFFEDNDYYSYEKLINTIPLDNFIKLVKDVPKSIKVAASKLNCTSLLLINVLSKGQTSIPYHWLYVYDDELLSTRITQSHLLSKKNTKKGYSALQVEVYESDYRKFKINHEKIKNKVCKELINMGIIDNVEKSHYQYINHANIIFDHSRKNNLNMIFKWLENFGLARELDDLDAITRWDNYHKFKLVPDLALAGRYGQWKYYWTDDCIMRGAQLSNTNILTEIIKNGR